MNFEILSKRGLIKIYIQPLTTARGLGIDGRTILEWILKKSVSIRGIGLIWLRIGIIGEPL